MYASFRCRANKDETYTHIRRYPRRSPALDVLGPRIDDQGRGLERRRSIRSVQNCCIRTPSAWFHCRRRSGMENRTSLGLSSLEQPKKKKSLNKQNKHA